MVDLLDFHKFQFLIGSLEAKISFGEVITLWFQFLIGSLEAHYHFIIVEYYLVSIPHR